MLLNCFTCVSVLELSHFDGKSGQAKIRVAKASGTAVHIIASSYSNKYKYSSVSTVNFPEDVGQQCRLHGAQKFAEHPL